jgi:lipoate-protein ligase A
VPDEPQGSFAVRGKARIARTPRPPLASLRVVDDPAAAAAWNMAVDEALLRCGEGATLRFYRWSPHAVSLGYFQSHRDFADVAASTPLVRRLTGGGAIHHGEELTFALTFDGDLLPQSIADSYRVLHDAIADALQAAGVPSRRLATGPQPSARPHQRWCFAAPASSDIVTDHGKLFGAAQRRVYSPGERVLHHGSLVLTQPALTPFVAAIDDLPSPPSAQALVESITNRIGRLLRLDPRPAPLTAAELDLAHHLERERYGRPDWNQRR